MLAQNRPGMSKAVLFLATLNRQEMSMILSYFSAALNRMEILSYLSFDACPISQQFSTHLRWLPCLSMIPNRQETPSLFLSASQSKHTTVHLNRPKMSILSLSNSQQTQHLSLSNSQQTWDDHTVSQWSSTDKRQLSCFCAVLLWHALHLPCHLCWEWKCYGKKKRR